MVVLVTFTWTRVMAFVSEMLDADDCGVLPALLAVAAFGWAHHFPNGRVAADMTGWGTTTALTVAVSAAKVVAFHRYRDAMIAIPAFRARIIGAVKMGPFVPAISVAFALSQLSPTLPRTA